VINSEQNNHEKAMAWFVSARMMASESLTAPMKNSSTSVARNDVTCTAAGHPTNNPAKSYCPIAEKLFKSSI
jgi:hypothetical protein